MGLGNMGEYRVSGVAVGFGDNWKECRSVQVNTGTLGMKIKFGKEQKGGRSMQKMGKIIVLLLSDHSATISDAPITMCTNAPAPKSRPAHVELRSAEMPALKSHLPVFMAVSTRALSSTSTSHVYTPTFCIASISPMYTAVPSLICTPQCLSPCSRACACI
jgi:hypothetical protein